MSDSVRRPSDSGASASRSFRPAYAAAIPAAAPSAASSRPSTSDCRSSRPRLAPSARRSAVSLPREAARAIRRPPTLTHAIIRRIPTPANSDSSGPRNSRVSSAWRPTVVNARAVPISPRILPATPSTSARACAIVTPGRMRATTRMNWLPRGPVSNSGQNGCHTCRRSGTPESSGSSSRNARGITPITVVGSSLTRICRPTIDGSPPNRRVKRSHPSRIDCGAPGRPSSSRNVRPKAGSAPRREKKLVVTNDVRSCSGSPSLVRATVPLAQMPPISENDDVPSRMSRKSGPDSGPREKPSQMNARRSASRYGSGSMSIA